MWKWEQNMGNLYISGISCRKKNECAMLIEMEPGLLRHASNNFGYIT